MTSLGFDMNKEESLRSQRKKNLGLGAICFDHLICRVLGALEAAHFLEARRNRAKFDGKTVFHS